MLKRKMYQTLSQWHMNSHKAFLVTGARQVGKSYVVREFGKAHYQAFVEYNLILDKEARRILTQAESAADFISRVALLSPEPLIEGDTLIFVDEIQECPDIVTLAKALVEDGRYSYAFSGSMLGTEFKGVTSFPVGYVDQYVMRPMDFEEFCWAEGIQEDTLARIREAFVARAPVEGYLHDVMMKHFRAYVVVGGMPEVVQNFVDGGGSLARTRALQSALVAQYEQDISKYAGTRAFHVRSIFDQIPVQLTDESHRFAVTSLGATVRYTAYDKDFLWVVNAGVGLKVDRVSEPKSPLRRTRKASLFKLYESDTGMLLSRYPQSLARAVYLNERRANLGGVFENVVAQEIAAHGKELYYYGGDEGHEVDFLIEGRRGHVVPIEVKSGKRVRQHASLDRLMASGAYGMSEAVVLCGNNLSCEGGVTYVPYYMTFCLDELTEREDDGFVIAPPMPV